MKDDRKLRAGENAFSWLMLLLSLFVLIQAYLISGFSSLSSAGTFPMGASAIMVVASIFILLNNLKLKKTAAGVWKNELRQAVKTVLPNVFLIYSVIVIVYIILIKPFHFLPSSFVFLFISMIYLKGCNVLKAFLISTITIGFIYLIFQYFFRVVLP
jgi:putative tricarboxylic transport membrane protein